MIDWMSVSKEDSELIHAITVRANKVMNTNVMSLDMDITAAHLSNPLALQMLLDADDENFFHDVGGITRHIDRQTGVLQDCFSPRFSLVNVGGEV